MRVLLPLRHRYVLHAGARVYAPSPEVTIEVRSKYGDFVPVLFKVDTGADLTTIPIPLAEEKGLPFTTEHPGSAIGIVGSVPKYAGSVYVRIAGKEYRWPCDFTPRPSSPETHEWTIGSSTTSHSPVLGRAGFLDDFALSMDGAYLTITRLGPFGLWWRRYWRQCWSAVHSVHDPDEPL